MNNRHEKITDALREVAAEFLVREANRNSLITVTAARLSDDNKRGVIYITVLPEEAEETALAFANRNRKEFADFFQTRIKGVFMPHVEFQIDRGEKSRQRLDELSQ
jgi:ribosome-binding factor A